MVFSDLLSYKDKNLHIILSCCVHSKSYTKFSPKSISFPKLSKTKDHMKYILKWGMAFCVISVPSFILNKEEKPGTVAHFCNPSTWEGEAGVSGVQSQH